MQKEDRRTAFVRLVNNRMHRTIKTLRLIGNLSNRTNYSYTGAQVDRIIEALEEAIEKMRERFEKGGAPEVEFDLEHDDEAVLITVTTELFRHDRHPVDLEDDPLGQYRIPVPNNLTGTARREAALDYFHDRVPIKVLEDYGIIVNLNPTSNELRSTVDLKGPTLFRRSQRELSAPRP